MKIALYPGKETVSDSFEWRIPGIRAWLATDPYTEEQWRNHGDQVRSIRT
jgi:hypothetical protein